MLVKKWMPVTETFEEFGVAMLSLYLSSFPTIKIITFFPPGLAVDALYMIIRHNGCCRKCMILGGAIANITEAVTMAVLFLKVPPLGLSVAALIAGVSGGIGGYIAYIAINHLKVLIPNLNSINQYP